MQILSIVSMVLDFCNVTIDVKPRNIKMIGHCQNKVAQPSIAQIAEKNEDISYICRKYHISKTSLMRWNRFYDGTRESLESKSHTAHLSVHTEQKIKWIDEKSFDISLSGRFRLCAKMKCPLSDFFSGQICFTCLPYVCF